MKKPSSWIDEEPSRSAVSNAETTRLARAASRDPRAAWRMARLGAGQYGFCLAVPSNRDILGRREV